jgi:hypothetical protein
LIYLLECQAELCGNLPRTLSPQQTGWIHICIYAGVSLTPSLLFFGRFYNGGIDEFFRDARPQVFPTQTTSASRNESTPGETSFLDGGFIAVDDDEVTVEIPAHPPTTLLA